MWRLVLLALVAPMLPTKPPEEPVTHMVTVAQLEQALHDEGAVSDDEFSRRLMTYKLTERVSTPTLNRLGAELKGPGARLAFFVVTDESILLPLPSSEVLDLPEPDDATRMEIFRKAEENAVGKVQKLPNFFATRTTLRMLGTPYVVDPELENSLILWSWSRFHISRPTSAKVRFVDGVQSFLDPKAAQKTECYDRAGIGGGEFETLGLAALVASQGTVSWSHWEQMDGLQTAVLRYQADLKYKLPRHCANEIHYSPLSMHFEGEIAVVPASGTILRVTLREVGKSNWYNVGDQPFDFTQMVEYAPVQIGTASYVCAKRAVEVSIEAWRADPDRREGVDHAYHLKRDPDVESIKDASFTDFHMFRAESHILDGAPDYDSSDEHPH